MKSNPRSFILVPHVSATILWNVFAIVETMCKIRSNYYIIELFGKKYVINCYSFLERGAISSALKPAIPQPMHVTRNFKFGVLVQTQ